MDTDDYYGILGVPSTATVEEIRRAYRSLAQTLHPDKQRDPELRDQATQLFAALSQAHEVLTDPRKREIFDRLGPDALRQGTAITTFDGDVKRKWEEMLEARERALGRATEFTSTTVLVVDGRPRPARSIRAMAHRNSVRAQALPTVNASMGFDFLSKQGLIAAGGDRVLLAQLGQATATGTADWTLSPDSHVQVSCTAGAESASATLVLSRNLTPSDQLLVQLQYQGTSDLLAGGSYPSLHLHLHRAFSTVPAANSGTLSWTVGPDTGLALTLQHKRPGDASVRGRSATLKVELGAGSAALTVAASKGTEWGSFGARVKLIAHSFPEIELSVTRKLGKRRSATHAVLWQPGGVVGKSSYAQAGHRLDVPVTWYGSPWASKPEEASWATLAAAAAPVLAAGVYLGIVRPARWAYRRFRAAAVTREDLEAAKRAQKLVDAVARLLRPVAEQSAREAMGAGGVVVVRADYGLLAEPARCVDVTHAVQWQCRGSRGRVAKVPGAGRGRLWGFADPCPGVPASGKGLRVLYVNGGLPHRAEATDVEDLELPQAAHRLSESDEAFEETLRRYRDLAVDVT